MDYLTTARHISLAKPEYDDIVCRNRMWLERIEGARKIDEIAQKPVRVSLVMMRKKCDAFSDDVLF
jgi:hypothetical protein